MRKKLLARLIVGLTLAVGICSGARAATISFPSTNPYLDVNGAFCLNCSTSYDFTLPSAYNVSILVGALGYIQSFSWSLEKTSGPAATIASGSGGPLFGGGFIASLPAELLGPGDYSFLLSGYIVASGYAFAISGAPVAVSGVPIPGAALLFGSGLAALSFSRRKVGKRSKAVSS